MDKAAAASEGISRRSTACLQPDLFAWEPYQVTNKAVRIFVSQPSLDLSLPTQLQDPFRVLVAQLPLCMCVHF